jgi:hypothetical protein
MRSAKKMKGKDNLFIKTDIYEVPPPEKFLNGGMRREKGFVGNHSLSPDYQRTKRAIQEREDEMEFDDYVGVRQMRANTCIVNKKQLFPGESKEKAYTPKGLNVVVV